MTPFTIAIADAEIADLKARLAQTRFPATLDDVGWDYGTDRDYLRELVDYWGQSFDWREAERRLNGFTQFTEVIDGERVHFVHVKGEGGNGVPLLLTNGWPSNFVELLPLVRLLTKAVNGQSFDVVIPSLPGFGFSGQPRQKGMHLSRIAPIWAELMSRLGYEKFLISGSDLGIGVEMALVRTMPQRLLGAHYVNVYPGYPRPSDPTAEEVAYFQTLDYWGFAEGGYLMIQGTKPATLAVGLNDSPAGLAAWIIEKFHSGIGGGIDRFDRDALCTILSVYWFTQTIGSSVRLYKEAFADPDLHAPVPRHDVPQAIFLPPQDRPAPRAYAERHLQNIVRWTQASLGGHFVALENPDSLAADIRGFARDIAG